LRSIRQDSLESDMQAKAPTARTVATVIFAESQFRRRARPLQKLECIWRRDRPAPESMGSGVARIPSNQLDLDYARLMARRSGMASRVVREILPGVAEARYQAQRDRWTRSVEGSGPYFGQGVRAVTAILDSLDEADRDRKRDAWKARFAPDGIEDFATLHARVAEVLGGESADPAAGQPPEKL
jgi:hypothetical protein